MSGGEEVKTINSDLSQYLLQIAYVFLQILDIVKYYTFDRFVGFKIFRFDKVLQEMSLIFRSLNCLQNVFFKDLSCSL